MNRRMIIHVLGELLLAETALMLLPCAVSVYYKDGDLKYFLMTMAIMAVLGAICVLFVKPRTKQLYFHDSFTVVALGWIFLSLFGCLPFFFSGEIPNFINALFESVSGFTTTGASILTGEEIDSLTRSMIFWRSFSHWVGGMGVLVFIMTVLPLSGGAGNLNLMRAESTGPDVGKLVPKSGNTARILYGIYTGMTAIEFVLLSLDLPFFDAVCMTFGTAGTGGFSITSAGLTEYSLYSKTVITVFMALFAVNFSLYYLILCGKIKDALKDEELHVYFGIMITVSLIITVNILRMSGSIYKNFGEALSDATFQVSSVMTTTGYSTADFDTWPSLSKFLMLLVMCIGGSAGGTGGGIKVSRIMLMIKSARKEIMSVVHPRSVTLVKMNGKKVDKEVVQSTNGFIIIYLSIFITSLLLISFDSGMDMLSDITAVIATLNNIGPGLGRVGPTQCFADYDVLSKIVFIADMLFGRLEIYPMLMLFSPVYKRKIIRKKSPVNYLSAE